MTKKDIELEQQPETPWRGERLKLLKEEARRIKNGMGWNGEHHPRFTLWEHVQDDYNGEEDEHKEKEPEKKQRKRKNRSRRGRRERGREESR